ncbi:DnaJ domain-containing protein [Pelagophyceae sp. CCMP2097]|nr:DnaJ domain-containing protein [Pelagophyceae sp. CCMP2097]
MDDARTHYEVLEAPIDASDEALRRNYKRLSVAKHPDRNRGHGAHDEFCRLQEAWEALREPQARAEYDRTLPSNTDFLIWCEVKHGSLARDGSRLCYECRCGGEFELSDDELRGGIDIVPCDSCSLHIRLVKT